MSRAIERLLSVLFCKRCAICGRIIGQEEEICSLCRADLPHHQQCCLLGEIRRNCVCEGDELPLTVRPPLFYYGGKARHLIHQLKFYGQQGADTVAGRFHGNKGKGPFPLSSLT